MKPWEKAVFKDGDRWSWKRMKMDDGTTRTSFWHWDSKQAALKDAEEHYYEYTGTESTTTLKKK